MSRPRKIKSVKEMTKLWIEYKAYCDTQLVLTHKLSSKRGGFVSQKIKRPFTYTIKGFCVYIGIARSNFYATYRKDKAFQGAITRAHEECAVDARLKFETGQIPSRLAKIWMGNYGYSDIAESPEAETPVDDWIQSVMSKEGEAK